MNLLLRANANYICYYLLGLLVDFINIRRIFTSIKTTGFRMYDKVTTICILKQCFNGFDTNGNIPPPLGVCSIWIIILSIV